MCALDLRYPFCNVCGLLETTPRATMTYSAIISTDLLCHTASIMSKPKLSTSTAPSIVGRESRRISGLEAGTSERISHDTLATRESKVTEEGCP